MARARTVYFAMIDGHEVGPITRAEFALRMTSSMVDQDTFVWTQGMDEWLPAAQVPDLAGMFQLREKARSAGLRPPPPPAAALAKGKAAAPAAAVTPPPPPPPPPEPVAKKPSFQDYSLAAPKSRRGGKAYGGAMPPPFVPQSSAPSEATPPLDELSVPVGGAGSAGGGRSAQARSTGDGDDDEHTTLDLLPLGERVHQEEVASTLFTSASGEHSVSGSGSTGAVALDEVKFAVESEKKAGIKRLSTSAAPLTTRPSPKPVPEPPPARRVPWRLLIAAVAVVAALGALALVLR